MIRLLCVLMAAGAIQFEVFGEVVLRNGRVIDAPVESVGPDGVLIGGDAPRILGWDVVYFSTGEFSDQIRSYNSFSDSVWRAKSRLARGDIELASPLFEEMFARLVNEGIAGPTGLVIAEGALRCRVMEHRHTAAIEAWVAALGIRETGQRQSGESGASGVIDARTMLVPSLPPVWLPGSEDARRLARLRIDSEATEGSQSELLLGLYRACAMQDLGIDPDPDSDRDSTGYGPGAVLLDRIVRSRSADGSVRSRAREELLGVIEEESGGWQEAWARIAVGRSYLMEGSADERDLGVLHLLHAPARFARSQPHLAAVALAEAGRELHARGDSESLERIRTELRERYPHHAAVEWLDAVISE